MSLPTVTPARAAAMLKAGEAILVDVREADERARSHIPGSAHLPISQLQEAELALQDGKQVIFHWADSVFIANTTDTLEGLWWFDGSSEKTADGGGPYAH